MVEERPRTGPDILQIPLTFGTPQFGMVPADDFGSEYHSGGMFTHESIGMSTYDKYLSFVYFAIDRIEPKREACE
jgi:hypothetical protein